MRDALDKLVEAAAIVATVIGVADGAERIAVIEFLAACASMLSGASAA